MADLSGNIKYKQIFRCKTISMGTRVTGPRRDGPRGLSVTDCEHAIKTIIISSPPLHHYPYRPMMSCTPLEMGPYFMDTTSTHAVGVGYSLMHRQTGLGNGMDCDMVGYLSNSDTIEDIGMLNWTQSVECSNNTVSLSIELGCQVCQKAI